MVSAYITLLFKIDKDNFNMSCVFFTDDVKVTAPVAVEDSIKQILRYI